MLIKVGVYTPLPYTIIITLLHYYIITLLHYYIITLLLLYRIVAYYGLFFRKPKDLGEIVAER